MLCVSGISNADIDAFGASSAADAVRKIAEENTEVDIVIATGISGLASAEERTNHFEKCPHRQRRRGHLRREIHVRYGCRLPIIVGDVVGDLLYEQL